MSLKTSNSRGTWGEPWPGLGSIAIGNIAVRGSNGLPDAGICLPSLSRGSSGRQSADPPNTGTNGIDAQLGSPEDSPARDFIIVLHESMDTQK